MIYNKNKEVEAIEEKEIKKDAEEVFNFPDLTLYAHYPPL
jgi:hypothetical protein